MLKDFRVDAKHFKFLNNFLIENRMTFVYKNIRPCNKPFKYLSIFFKSYDSLEELKSLNLNTKIKEYFNLDAIKEFVQPREETRLPDYAFLFGDFKLNEGKIDSKEFVKHTKFRMDVIAKGLVFPKISEDEIKSLNQKATEMVAQIADEIIKFSNEIPK